MTRHVIRRMVPSKALIAVAAAAACTVVVATAAQDASAIGVTKCYFPSSCSWANLGSGDVKRADWDANGTEGGAMPSNGNVPHSRRWRIVQPYTTTPVAGWWTTAGGNAQISVAWPRQAWISYQCNNMEQFSISVFCRSDNVG